MAKYIDVVEPHSLTQGKALELAKGLLAKVKAEHVDKFTIVKEQWSGCKCTFSLIVSTFSLSGTLEVAATDVIVKSEKLPLLVGLVKGKIEKVIREQAKQLFTQAE